MDLETLVAGTARLTPGAPPGPVSSWHPPTGPGPGSKLREFWSCLCLESLVLAENESEGCRHRILDPEPLPGACTSIFITQRTEKILSIILMCWQTIGHYLAVSSLLTLVTSGGLLISAETWPWLCVVSSRWPITRGDGEQGDQSELRHRHTDTHNTAQHTWATFTKTSTILNFVNWEFSTHVFLYHYLSSVSWPWILSLNWRHVRICK